MREGAAMSSMVEYMLATTPGPAQELLRRFDASLDRAGPTTPGDSPPSVLYHYTVWEGFRGILTNQVFWATDHHDVADKGELRAAESRIDAVLVDLESEVSEPCAHIIREFRAFYSSRQVADHITLYLTCFTGVRDNRYHWKEYAKNDGACLAIKVLRNEESPTDYQGTKVFRALREVVYDLQVAEKRIRDGFRSVLKEYESIVETARLWNVGTQAQKQAQVQLAIVAANVGITSKAHDFHEEVEWRSTVLLWDPVIPEVTNGGKRFLPIRFRQEWEAGCR